MKPNKQALKILARAREDFQEMRKRMDNRIGRKADGSNQEIKERMFIAEDVDSFVKIADAAKDQEKEIEKKLLKVLRRFDIYNEWLTEVKGIGTVTAAYIVGEFDIHIASTVSKLWQYSGLNPGMIRGKKRIQTKNPDTYEPKKDGWEVLKRAEDHVLVLTDERIRGDKLTSGFISPYNKGLKTVLMGILAPGFIKAGIRYHTVKEEVYNDTEKAYRRKKGSKKQVIHKILSPYAEHYLRYKQRLIHSEKKVNHRKPGGKVEKTPWKDVSKGHRDMAARRYMVKMFLKDLYVVWRELEGLETREPYQDKYLGHRHTG